MYIINTEKLIIHKVTKVMQQWVSVKLNFFSKFIWNMVLPMTVPTFETHEIFKGKNV